MQSAIISSYVACAILPYLSTSSYKTARYLGKSSEHKHVFRLSVQILSETFLIIRRTERDIIIKAGYVGLHVKNPLFLSDFNET